MIETKLPLSHYQGETDWNQEGLPRWRSFARQSPKDVSSRTDAPPEILTELAAWAGAGDRNAYLFQRVCRNLQGNHNTPPIVKMWLCGGFGMTLEEFLKVSQS